MQGGATPLKTFKTSSEIWKSVLKQTGSQWSEAEAGVKTGEEMTGLIPHIESYSNPIAS